MAAYEMNAFKDEYQRAVIENAKSFAASLKAEGLDVAGDPAVGYTETHQVIVRVGYARGPEIAKRLEEVWLPGEEYPVIMPRASEGLYMLQRLRDEAHRFAITHHRSRRAKHVVESVLDDVPGLGELRRKALLTYFGSLRKLRQASEAEIAEVPGFGPTLAAAVKAAVAGTGGDAGPDDWQPLPD